MPAHQEVLEIMRHAIWLKYFQIFEETPHEFD